MLLLVCLGSEKQNEEDVPPLSKYYWVVMRFCDYFAISFPLRFELSAGLLVSSSSEPPVEDDTYPQDVPSPLFASRAPHPPSSEDDASIPILPPDVDTAPQFDSSSQESLQAASCNSTRPILETDERSIPIITSTAVLALCNANALPEQSEIIPNIVHNGKDFFSSTPTLPTTSRVPRHEQARTI